MDPSNPESPPASPPGESMRPAAVQLDDGSYFFLPMDGGEWTEVRVREGKLFRLVAIDEGVPLLEVLGSFSGPLRMPKLTVVKVH